MASVIFKILVDYEMIGRLQTTDVYKEMVPVFNSNQNFGQPMLSLRLEPQSGSLPSEKLNGVEGGSRVLRK